jgi:hypothetical protein
LNDGVTDTHREYSWLDWNSFYKKRRHNRFVKEEDFTTRYSLCLSRLPGMESLTTSEYQSKIMEEFERRRLHLVLERRRCGKPFLGAAKLRVLRAGSKPVVTKSGTRSDHRPLVLSLCVDLKRQILSKYFSIFESFKKASYNFRRGNLLTSFPVGTYRPPDCVCIS